MEVDKFRVENFKSIKDSESLSITSFNTFIGKNDAGKSSFLEALTIFLQKEKPGSEHFHKKREDEIVFKATLKDYSELLEYLNEDYRSEEDEMVIKRVFKHREGTTPKADTYVNGEKLSKGAIKSEGDKLSKSNSRDFIWDKLPKAIFVPAERNVSEETKLKRGTFLNDILVPILEKGGVEDNKEIKEAKEVLENKLDEASNEVAGKLGENMKEHMSDIEEVKLNTGDISVKKAISPEIMLEDKYLPDSVNISQRGSGVGSLFILSLMQTYVDMQLGEGYYLLFEEPGNWLHPGAERQMAETLREISKEGSKIMVSTHSQVFINQNKQENMYLVKRQDGESDYRQINKQAFEVIDEIGARNSDLLQSDYVIYVEGPSDKEILEEVARHIEGWRSKNITVQHLGGTGNISHCDPEDLRDINRKLAFLLDSDKSSRDSELRDEIKEIRGSCDDLDIPCKVLNKRTIENYFTSRAIEEVFGFDSLEDEFVEPFDDMPKKIDQKLESTFGNSDYNKVTHGRRIVSQMYEFGEGLPELEKFLRECLNKC